MINKFLNEHKQKIKTKMFNFNNNNNNNKIGLTCSHTRVGFMEKWKIYINKF